MEQSDNKFLNDALRYKLLTKNQAEEIRAHCTDSTLAKDVAVSKGYLNARKLDVLSALQAPEDVVPGYQIDSVIGYGGFGVVYKARQQNLDRTVALKIIPLAHLNDDSAQKRFEREAKIVGQLRHPNIITAFDYGLHNERLFLSMEYILGVDAERYLERKGQLSEENCWNIIRQVAMALTFAAEHEVIHRDIKPGNIMLTEPPVGYQLPPGVPMVKVADFGLACFNENHSRDDRITVADTAVGTPYYVSPEQLLGDDVDQRADIYSLGATAWHFLAGQPPMADEQSMKIVAAKMTGDSSWLSTMPAHWTAATQQLLRSMCDHNPNDRISTHLELIATIDQMFEHSNASGDPTVKRLSSGSILGLDRPDQPDAPFEDTPADISTREFKTGRQSIDALAQTSDALSTQVTSKDTPSSNRIVAWLLFAGPVVIGIAAIALGLSLGGFRWGNKNINATNNSKSQDQNIEIELTKFMGPPIFLFNGRSIDPTQRSTGNWEVDKDFEEASVLAGNGTRNFKCVARDGQPFKYFQFSLGFMHHKAKTIAFLIKSKNGNIGKLLITREMSKLFDAEEQPKFDHTDQVYKFDDETTGYHNVKIQRHIGYWVFLVDGNLIGKIRSADNSMSNVELQVMGDGPAHFEQIEIQEFSHKK